MCSIGVTGRPQSLIDDSAAYLIVLDTDSLNVIGEIVVEPQERILNSQIYEWELQEVRCSSLSVTQGDLVRCVSCTQKSAGDTCRFCGTRVLLLREDDVGGRVVIGYWFRGTSTSIDEETFDFRDEWSSDVTGDDMLASKVSILSE